MLAQSFKPARVNYPCQVQPKLDGVRCISTVKDGTVTMLTRMDKEILSMTHIKEELSKLPDGTYDGELYSNELLFDTISGHVRRHRFIEGESDQVKFFIYDCFKDVQAKSNNYVSRRAALSSILVNMELLHIVLTPSDTAHSESDLMQRHEAYIADGYEGSMVRTEVYNRKTKTWSDPGYEDKRSFALLKVKDFFDMDCEIIGIQEEIDKHGVAKGRTGAFECKTLSGKVFTASGIKDTVKRDSYRDRGSYIGQTAIIKYFELTPDGVPRFPNFVGIRAD